MPPPISFLQQLAQKIAQRAMASFLDSVLDDVGAAAHEVNARTTRARSRLKKILEKQEDDEE